MVYWIIAAYITLSIVIYFAARQKCKKNLVFKAPRSPTLFYILSFTWGLPMVLFGLIVAGILRILGNKPKKYGWELYFEFPNLSWGLELGICFVGPNVESLKIHEHGHGIQNIYFGIFTPAVVSIPSAARFWYREFRSAIKKPCKTKYADIWFEKSADETGKAFIEKRNNS